MLIYKITNIVNNKVYIGQTTKTLEERKKNYLNEYKWNKNPRVIIRAMRKYGFDNFKFEILEDNIKTQQELDNRERYYITEVYHSLVEENGYNVERGGNGQGKHTEITKQKIGDAQKGELNHMFGKTGELNKTSKKILELTTDKIYGSACEAARALNINFSHVCAVARGTRGSTGGYVFRYLDENDEPIKIESVKIKSSLIRQKILSKYQYLI